MSITGVLHEEELLHIRIKQRVYRCCFVFGYSGKGRYTAMACIKAGSLHCDWTDTVDDAGIAEVRTSCRKAMFQCVEGCGGLFRPTRLNRFGLTSDSEGNIVTGIDTSYKKPAKRVSGKRISKSGR